MCKKVVVKVDELHQVLEFNIFFIGLYIHVIDRAAYSTFSMYTVPANTDLFGTRRVRRWNSLN